MIIKELKPSGRVAGRWLAVLEDGSILRIGEGEVLNFALCSGKELTGGEAEALQSAARRSSLRERAIAALSRRPQSRRELERRLAQWEASEEDTAVICDRMEELGYLNDAYYACQVVRHYSAKGFGEKKLRDELYRRGIPRELWDDALGEASDPGAAIGAFLEKKLAGRCPDREECRKLSAALARRGFRWEDVSDALRRYGSGEDD